MVTQDKSPCLCSERHDEYLFGRAKSGGLGQVTTPQKKNHGKKVGITRPRPDGGVTNKLANVSKSNPHDLSPVPQNVVANFNLTHL